MPHVPKYDFELIARLWAEGKSIAEIRQHPRCDSAMCVSLARLKLGVERVPIRYSSGDGWASGKRTPGHRPKPHHYAAAEMWRDGVPQVEIDTKLGLVNAVLCARNVLGVELVPLRPAHPKQDKPKTPGLISSRDINRHIARRLSHDEYVVRDHNFVEELWKRDEHGIVFRYSLRLSFVIVMGMAERRVPADLAHLFK